MKSGYIYLIKTTDGKVHEGIHLCTIRKTHIFDPLPFISSTPCPHLIPSDSVEWSEEVIQMARFTTESMYRDALTTLSQK